MIKAKDAHIFWDELMVERGELNKPTARVLVTDTLEGPHNDPGSPHRYAKSWGAHANGWCTDDHPLSSPEGVFALCLFGAGTQPAPLPVFKAWLGEFSKIEECGWARKMLAALEATESGGEM